MQSRFEAHGTIHTTLKGKVLCIDAIGPWNLESLHQSSLDAKPLLDKLSGDSWGVMAVFHGECIFVPAAMRRLSEAIRLEKKRGRVATAILVNDTDMPNFAKMHLSDIYDDAQEDYHFFDDLELAEKWLIEKI